MNNFDDIFEQGAASSYSSPIFDKDAWAAKKQEERRKVYDLIDLTTNAVKSGGEMYREFLDVQTRFERYSIANALLIFAQMPNATKLRDYEGWRDLGCTPRKKEQGISILEPGPEYEREDGSIGISYRVKKVFDLSQTTMRETKESAMRFDDRALLRALIQHPPVPIQTVDKLAGNQGAFYNHEKQTIYVRRGMNASDIFRCVSTEIAHAELAVIKENYRREEAAFAAYSISYMLGKKYGIDVSGYDFQQLPEKFRNGELQQVRANLQEIRDTASGIISRMGRALEQSRKNEEKGQER